MKIVRKSKNTFNKIKRYKIVNGIKKHKNNNLFKSLCRICQTKQNQDLKTYCTIGIGGVGKYVCFPKSVGQVKKLVNFLNKKDIKFFILGNGSNVVFEDSGYSGVLICLTKLNKIYFREQKLTAYSGVNLFVLNNFCLQKSLTGFEFSYGIPASVGGAVFMNAGAFGKEMADVVKSVWVLDKNRIKKLCVKQLDYSYRHSAFMKGGKYQNAIILKAELKLKSGESEKIKETQQEILNKRLQSQPYGTKNAGSIFKKIGENGAGKIIDKMGLKSVTIGDIQISPVHANFFVNLGKATSLDLHSTIRFVKNKVKNEMGEILQEEIIFVGD